MQKSGAPPAVGVSEKLFCGGKKFGVATLLPVVVKIEKSGENWDF
ncbi:hypothetical protein R6G85_04260 [Actinotignum urinale]|nr:hypothetical protein [Actinotignum urinale]MDY5151701.1 hypothetical protein [Actinotignum urinale]WIK59694.1 hypothetical protein CJ184_003390 [Actinotignum urinale]